MKYKELEDRLSAFSPQMKSETQKKLQRKMLKLYRKDFTTERGVWRWIKSTFLDLNHLPFMKKSLLATLATATLFFIAVFTFAFFRITADTSGSVNVETILAKAASTMDKLKNGKYLHLKMKDLGSLSPQPITEVWLDKDSLNGMVALKDQNDQIQDLIVNKNGTATHYQKDGSIVPPQTISASNIPEKNDDFVFGTSPEELTQLMSIKDNIVKKGDMAATIKALLPENFQSGQVTYLGQSVIDGEKVEGITLTKTVNSRDGNLSKIIKVNFYFDPQDYHLVAESFPEQPNSMVKYLFLNSSNEAPVLYFGGKILSL